MAKQDVCIDVADVAEDFSGNYGNVLWFKPNLEGWIEYAKYTYDPDYPIKKTMNNFYRSRKRRLETFSSTTPFFVIEASMASSSSSQAQELPDASSEVLPTDGQTLSEKLLKIKKAYIAQDEKKQLCNTLEKTPVYFLNLQLKRFYSKENIQDIKKSIIEFIESYIFKEDKEKEVLLTLLLSMKPLHKSPEEEKFLINNILIAIKNLERPLPFDVSQRENYTIRDTPTLPLFQEMRGKEAMFYPAGYVPFYSSTLIHWSLVYRIYSEFIRQLSGKSESFVRTLLDKYSETADQFKIKYEKPMINEGNFDIRREGDISPQIVSASYSLFKWIHQDSAISWFITEGGSNFKGYIDILQKILADIGVADIEKYKALLNHTWNTNCMMQFFVRKDLVDVLGYTSDTVGKAAEFINTTPENIQVFKRLSSFLDEFMKQSAKYRELVRMMRAPQVRLLVLNEHFYNPEDVMVFFYYDDADKPQIDETMEQIQHMVAQDVEALIQNGTIKPDDHYKDLKHQGQLYNWAEIPETYLRQDIETEESKGRDDLYDEFKHPQSPSTTPAQ